MEMAAVVCSLKYNNFTIESTFAVFEPFIAVRVLSLSSVFSHQPLTLLIRVRYPQTYINGKLIKFSK